MGAGVNRNMAGSFIGTGAEISIRTVGFRPKRVDIFNETGDCMAFWTASMADASAMKTIAAGTTAFITSNGITPLSDGFKLGADTDLNVSAEKFHWFAQE